MHEQETLWRQFEQFSPGPRQAVRMFFAPGRVNLIGEHTDYNGGFVFPAALTMGVWAWVRTRTDGIVRFYSMEFPQAVERKLSSLRYDNEDDYANYPKGVIDAIQSSLHVTFTGGDFFFYSNLPNGAGLSSSAALEVVTGTAVSSLSGESIGPEQIARLSQHAENHFVGVNCGIMDQFAVAMGRRDHAISLNCQTLEYTLVPVVLGDYRLVISNTNHRRGLADSKYNERRQECEDALSRVSHLDAGWAYLADIPESRWQEVYEVLENEPVLLKRARHIMTENKRAKDAVRVLSAGDLEQFGCLMNQSHESLRDDYEVTGTALDALVEAAWEVEGCIGSRMTGAGFGGCTVSIVRADRVEAFQSLVAKRYTEQTALEPTFYVSSIGDGARELDEGEIAK
ncbi:galactokinase [Alicyclobacillus dauci]|uniref:Galactokinase n=1 Tax=Alicyclobacillus dauci TaxID=1475485 RepID=A0ABY6YZL0_9BACL|nr:galactokinase [Alicyclobacillus dauci]WAH35950.1 galactokinase [Alicyclobacillus dauci]